MVVPAFEKNQMKRKTKATAKKMTTKTTAIHKAWHSAVPGLLGTIGLALVTVICFRLQVGLATAALLYLMIVVLVSLKGCFISSMLP